MHSSIKVGQCFRPHKRMGWLDFLGLFPALALDPNGVFWGHNDACPTPLPVGLQPPKRKKKHFPIMVDKSLADAPIRPFAVTTFVL